LILTPRKTRRAPCMLRAVCLPLLLLAGLHEAGFPSSARALDSREGTSALDSDTQAAPLSLDLQKQMDLIRARILSRRGLFPESLSLYQELRARFPGDREIRLDFIETLVNEGATDAAEQELGAYLLEYPGDSRGLRIRARLLFEQGRFEATYPLYDQLLMASPEDVWIWSDYGYARQEGGDWSGALRCFSRVLEVDPENESALRSVHWILRDHLPRLNTGYRVYRQEEGDATWATGFLRYERHLTEKTWWTFSYDRVRMDRPEQPFLPAVNETLHHASFQVDYRVNRFFTGRAGAGLFSGLGGGTDLTLGMEGRPDPAMVLRAEYAHGRPWTDPMEAVDEEGRENRLLLSGEWSGWSPWTVSIEAEQSDFEVRDLEDYGRRRGILGILSRRFGENPFLLMSYSYSRRRFDYGSEAFRPVLLIEREHVHGLSALLEHRPCTYLTYRLFGGVGRDTARELDSWFIQPEVLVRMGNRIEGRLSFQHSSETGTVTGGASRTLEAGLRILF